MENPFLEQGKLYAHMLVTSLAGKCGFVGIAATVSLESTLEATVYKKGVEPPQQVVPVVQHGQLLKGAVTLVAPAFGKPPSFGGLTVRLHVARMLKHGGAPKHSKEQAEALKSMPTWMQPKDTAIVHAFDAPLHVTADVIVLGPGTYEVDGEIKVPFTISTAELPLLESFQAGDESEVCHWVEAHIAQVGWRGRCPRTRSAPAPHLPSLHLLCTLSRPPLHLRCGRGRLNYVREGWSSLNMESAKQRIRLRKKGGAGTAFAIPQP